MDQGNQSLFLQAETLQEITATFLEKAVDHMNLFSSDIDFDNLSNDQQIAFTQWRKGIEQAAQTIRTPN
tara:strand:- start:2249 stop:2455 length:207 start_codon:yes stop_codon:yes gene_type:complete